MDVRIFEFWCAVNFHFSTHGQKINPANLNFYRDIRAFNNVFLSLCKDVLFK